MRTNFKGRRRRHHHRLYCPPFVCWRTLAFYLTLGLVLVFGAAAHAKEFKLQRWLPAQTDMAEIKARECPADKTLSCEILCHGPEIKCWPMFEKIIKHSLKCEGRGTGLSSCEDKRAYYEWGEMNLHETTITKVPK